MDALLIVVRETASDSLREEIEKLKTELENAYAVEISTCLHCQTIILMDPLKFQRVKEGFECSICVGLICEDCARVCTSCSACWCDQHGMVNACGQCQHDFCKDCTLRCCRCNHWFCDCQPLNICPTCSDNKPLCGSCAGDRKSCLQCFKSLK